MESWRQLIFKRIRSPDVHGLRNRGDVFNAIRDGASSDSAAWGDHPKHSPVADRFGLSSCVWNLHWPESDLTAAAQASDRSESSATEWDSPGALR